MNKIDAFCEILELLACPVCKKNKFATKNKITKDLFFDELSGGKTKYFVNNRFKIQNFEFKNQITPYELNKKEIDIDRYISYNHIPCNTTVEVRFLDKIAKGNVCFSFWKNSKKIIVTHNFDYDYINKNCLYSITTIESFSYVPSVYKGIFTTIVNCNHFEINSVKMNKKIVSSYLDNIIFL